MIWFKLQVFKHRLIHSLIVIEHQNDKLASSSLNCIAAAKKIGNKMTALIGGNNIDNVVNQIASINGISKVIVAKSQVNKFILSEHIASLVVQVQKAFKFTHIIAPANSFGKSFMPRASAMLNSSQISDITSIESEDTFIRPIYAGNALCKVQSLNEVKFLTIRTTAFPHSLESSGKAEIEQFKDPKIELAASEFIKEEVSKSDRPDLATAEIVVSGGRGLKNGENFKMIYELAEKLGAGGNNVEI
jgi:electron transfer flavoprotein alpha subunit